MRRLRTLVAAVVALVVLAPCVSSADDDAARGYAKLRPSLVKVWAFDRGGNPIQSGSGLVIVSNAARSIVLTAAHVVAGAATIKVDLDRDHHDLVARVQQRGPRDLALIALDAGHLTAATFAPHTRAVVEGNLIAVAGFVKNDELIGVVGQEPRLLYPGTISSRPDDGAYLELENVHVEEGLSGGPVFDPDSGDVLGIVTSRTSDRRGGFADSAALVVLPFLASNGIAFRERSIVRVAQQLAPPQPAPTPPPQLKPQPVAKPSPAAKPAPVAKPAIVVKATAVVKPPRPAPTPSVVAAADEPRAWEVQDAPASRLVYNHRGCEVALSVSIEQLDFSLPAASDPASATPDGHLTLRIARRVAAVAACADIAESNPAEADYESAASSYDGRHVTIRFRHVDQGNSTGADDALFPADVSVDADLKTAPVIAHVQLIDADWDGTLDVTASRDR